MVEESMGLHLFLGHIVKGIVDHPEDVLVRTNVQEGVICLAVRMNDQDVGQVIGRKGAIARNIRGIMAAAAGRIHVRCHIEILEAGTETQIPCGNDKQEEVLA